jgi:hypothetical protein
MVLADGSDQQELKIVRRADQSRRLSVAIGRDRRVST